MNAPDPMRAAFAAARPSAGEGWPELVPFEGAELPRLRADMLGGWAGDFAGALSAFTETPVELPAALVLGALATAAARRFAVEVKPGYREPCNLWTLAALPPGNRKSGVQRAATAPLLAWERDAAEAMGGDIAVSRSLAAVAKERAKALRDDAKRASEVDARELALQAADIERRAPEEVKAPQLWTSDATPERLGALLAENGERMAWLSAEAGFFELVGGRYNNGVPNLDLMLKAHVGDAERVDRGSRPPVFLRFPLLTIALSPQPDVLRGLARKPGFRGRGLLGRFIYFLPPSPLGWRNLDGPPIPPAVAAAYNAGMRAMLDAPAAVDDRGEPALHVLRLSPGALAEWKAFEAAMEVAMRPGGDFEHATDWAAKAAGAAARVAGVLHAAEHAHGDPAAVEVEAATMERALEIVAVAARHALAAFAMMEADDGATAALRLWRWVERRRAASFTAREAWQGLKGGGLFGRMGDVEAALAALEERGYLRPVADPSQPRPGRPASPPYEVRPDFVEAWR